MEHSSTRRILQPMLILVIVIAVLAFRRYDAFLNPQLWAEDGIVFLQQYYDLGWKSLITPYAGYLNTAQRLIVWLFGTIDFNLYYIPALYCGAVVLIIYGIALRAWHSARAMGMQHSVFFAVFFLLVPITSDVFMNITNLNGILSLYLICRLYAREYVIKGTGRLILDSLLIVIISLSGPASILLSPVVVVALVVERKTLHAQRLVRLLLILLCGAIQLYYVKFVDTNFYRGTEGVTEPYHLIKFFTKNVGDIFYLQDPFAAGWSYHTRTIVSAVLFMLLTVAFVYVYANMKHRDKYILVLAAGLYVASVIKSYWPNESYLFGMRNASRYFLVPYTCMGWLLIHALDKRMKWPHVLLYAGFFAFHRPHMQFQLADKHWGWQIMEYRAGKREMIDINPEGWKFRLPPDAQK